MDFSLRAERKAFNPQHSTSNFELEDFEIKR